MRPTVHEELAWRDALLLEYFERRTIHVETCLRGALRDEVGVGGGTTGSCAEVVSADHDVALRCELTNHELRLDGAVGITWHP